MMIALTANFTSSSVRRNFKHTSDCIDPKRGIRAIKRWAECNPCDFLKAAWSHCTTHSTKAYMCTFLLLHAAYTYLIRIIVRIVAVAVVHSGAFSQHESSSLPPSISAETLYSSFFKHLLNYIAFCLFIF